MSTRRQVISFLVVTAFAVTPALAMSARVTDSTTGLTALTHPTSPSPLHDATEDLYGDAGMVQFSEAETWDKLELAVPEPADELDLAVAGEENNDEYELALPDANDGLELAQAHGYGFPLRELEDE